MLFPITTWQFPEVAVALMPICEIFGSISPTVLQASNSGEDISVYMVFSCAFLLLLRLWKFYRPPHEQCLLGKGAPVAVYIKKLCCYWRIIFSVFWGSYASNIPTLSLSDSIYELHLPYLIFTMKITLNCICQIGTISLDEMNWRHSFVWGKI